jgi:hypothetical protein
MAVAVSMIHYHTSHFSVDAEHGKACNLHVAKRFSTEGIDPLTPDDAVSRSGSLDGKSPGTSGAFSAIPELSRRDLF